MTTLWVDVMVLAICIVEVVSLANCIYVAIWKLFSPYLPVPCCIPACVCCGIWFVMSFELCVCHWRFLYVPFFSLWSCVCWEISSNTVQYFTVQYCEEGNEELLSGFEIISVDQLLWILCNFLIRVQMGTTSCNIFASLSSLLRHHKIFTVVNCKKLILDLCCKQSVLFDFVIHSGSRFLNRSLAEVLTL